MPIKKLLDSSKAKEIGQKLDALFQKDSEIYGHQIKISTESIVNSWSHPSLLNNTMHTWISYQDNEMMNPDGIIMFLDSINPTFGERMFIEYLWFCKNPKSSFLLLKTALDFAKNKNIKYAFLSCVEKHPKLAKLQKVYERLGFVKDSSTYIKKL